LLLSAATAIWLAICNLLQESQALNNSAVITAAPMIAITDFNNTLTDNRLTMVFSPLT
jgi:hypothetical protein